MTGSWSVFLHPYVLVDDLLSPDQQRVPLVSVSVNERLEFGGGGDVHSP